MLLMKCTNSLNIVLLNIKYKIYYMDNFMWTTCEYSLQTDLKCYGNKSDISGKQHVVEIGNRKNISDYYS